MCCVKWAYQFAPAIEYRSAGESETFSKQPRNTDRGAWGGIAKPKTIDIERGIHATAADADQNIAVRLKEIEVGTPERVGGRPDFR